MKKRICLLLVFAFCLFGLGCEDKEHLSKLNHQNRGAAETIKKQVLQTPPDLTGASAAADDIAKNSEEMAERLPPVKNPLPYTTGNSKTTRDGSEKARIEAAASGGLWTSILEGLIGAIPGLGGFGGIAVAGWSLYRKWKADKKVMAGYVGANNVLDTVKRLAGEKRIPTVEEIKTLYRDAQAVYNVGPDVVKDLQRLRRLGGMKKVKDDPAPSIGGIDPETSFKE